MEVIRLSGYTEDEKVHIAFDHLLPKLMKNNGVQEGELTVAEAAIRDIVRYYTREAGVRALEREISKICRKAVKRLLTANPVGKGHQTTKTQKSLTVDSDKIGQASGREGVGQYV